jgi:acyl-CoA reductase-like NAD-dependent aldehyde dehydrogenase
MTTQTYEYWLERARSLRPAAQAFIDGEFVDSLSGKEFESYSPRDGALIARVAECDSADVDRAVAAARAAFNDRRWWKQPPQTKKNVLRRLAELVNGNRETFALVDSLDMGKPISDAYQLDVAATVRCLEFYAECVDKVYDEIAPTGPDSLGLVQREPIGVVGTVIPWNYPLLLAAWKLGPALATGNSVVLKPAEQSPLSALLLAQLATEAGLPDGVLNVVPGFGETAGAAIGLHSDIDAVAFTGSDVIGKLFLRYSSESNMKAVSLECGGKSPHIVFADTPDLEKAAENVALGIFFNQGEVCSAGSRLLVEFPVAKDFVEMVASYASAYIPKDPLDPTSRMGAIVNEAQMERILSYIELGVDEGAELVTGGHRVLSDSGGYFVEPTILDRVEPRMRVAREEIFGPVLSVLPFSDVDHAVELGNATAYGLAAGIWSNDLDKVHRTAAGLRVGTIWVNGWDTGDITVPFGGYKQSGLGRDKSLHALEKYTQLKTTWINLG